MEESKSDCLPSDPKDGIVCRVRKRRQTANDNIPLFCRLPKSTLRALLPGTDLVGPSGVLEENNENNNWQLAKEVQRVLDKSHSQGTAEEIVADHIEFLPLELTLQSNNKFCGDDHGGMDDRTARKIYVSYNGGLLPETTTANRLGKHGDHYELELAESLLKSQQEDLDEDVLVTASVRIVPLVQNASEITLEPLSSRDYQLLHQHAETLEAGGLLRQVSLVYHGQVLELDIESSTRNSSARARVQILNDEPNDSMRGEEVVDPKELEWPSSSDDEEEDDELITVANGFPTHAPGEFAFGSHTSVPCLRLVANSRIVVSGVALNDSNEPLHLIPCPTLSDYLPSMRSLAHTSNVLLPDPLPGMAWLHPRTAERLHIHDQSLVEVRRVSSTARRVPSSPPNTEVENPEEAPLLESLVVRVVLASEEAIGPQQIALHPWQAQTLQLDVTSNEHRIQLEPLPSWKIEQATSKLSDFLASSETTLKLGPVSISSSDLAWMHRMESARFDEKALFSLGSLIVWDHAVYQLQIGSTKGDIAAHWHTKEKSYNNYFVFGSDLQTWLCRKHTLALFTASSPGKSMMLISPSIQSPRRLSLIPEPSVIPSTLASLPFHSIHDANILLYGLSGSGKTYAALVVAALARFRNNASSVYLDCKAEKDRAPQLDYLLQTLTDLVYSALATQRACVVILDDWDEICPNLLLSSHKTSPSTNNSSSTTVEQTSPAEVEQAKVVRDHMLKLLDSDKERLLAFVVTCRNVDSSLLGFPHHGIRRRLALPVMAPNEKVALLEKIICLSNSGGELPSYTLLSGPADAGKQSLTSLPLEFRLCDLLPKDIEMIASRVLKQCDVFPEAEPATVLHHVLNSYVPLNRRAAAEEPLSAVLDWHKDVGGLFEAKQALVDLVVRPMRFRRIYETARIRLPKGILLFGPPGCGKSILPAALAQEVGLPLIVCRGPEILDKYIGASERKVREIFERSSLSAPSILFIDELDALAPHRGSDSTGVTDRVVNQFLTFLDGVEDVSFGKAVYILAASSRPDKIDSALLRPGRLEKHVYVGRPASREEFRDVFLKVARKYRFESGNEACVLSGDVIESELFESMSPSDIKSLLDTAHTLAVREFLAMEGDGIVPPKEPSVNERHFRKAMTSTGRGISASERLRLQKIYERFQNHKARYPQGKCGDAALRVALK